MRKYRKWVMTLGLVAAAPSVGLAGPFDFVRNDSGKQAAGMTNQEVAEQVAQRLGKANIKGAEVEIIYLDGTLTLKGDAPTADMKALIGRMASTVNGVRTLKNEMTVAGAAAPATRTPRPRMRPAVKVPVRPVVKSAAYQARPGMKPMVRPTSQKAVAPPPAPAATPAPATPPMPPRTMRPRPAAVPPAPPAWAHGGAAATGAVYDQPAMPNYAWPTYAAYPNYAALTYPRQYSASAWPYIGPFYPYPQVPLGWRDVTLQWDDGHWFLDFNQRTERWWWFFNPKNW